MKWYEQRYADHRDWIVDNMEYLGLSAEEVLAVLIIDFLNEHHMDVSLSTLSKKMHITESQVNDILSILVAKRYLSIKASHSKVVYSLNGLFDINVEQELSVRDGSLFDLFEQEFGRPLTQKEMETISRWIREEDSGLVMEALKHASMYQKVKIPYIQSVLNSLKTKGLNNPGEEEQR